MVDDNNDGKPVPADDEDWTADTGLDDSADANSNESSNYDEPGYDESDYDAQSPHTSPRSKRRETSRRGALKHVAAGALGALGISGLGFGAAMYATGGYNGGNAENTTVIERGGPGEEDFDNEESQDNSGMGNNQTNSSNGAANETINGGNESNNSGNESSLGNETDNTTENESEIDDEDDEDIGDIGDGGEDDPFDTYSLEGEVEIDLNTLEDTYDESSVVMGVQDNGNLVAWNTDVEVGDEGYNPLWRFKSENFPNREHYDVEGEHPVEALYDELDVSIEELTEDMVNIFYDPDEDEGSWEDHSQYKEVSFRDLVEGVAEYESLGHAQDYFVDRKNTLDEGEQTLESEWQELLQDGL